MTCQKIPPLVHIKGVDIEEHDGVASISVDDAVIYLNLQTIRECRLRKQYEECLRIMSDGYVIEHMTDGCPTVDQISSYLKTHEKAALRIYGVNYRKLVAPYAEN